MTLSPATGLEGPGVEPSVSCPHHHMVREEQNWVFYTHVLRASSPHLHQCDQLYCSCSGEVQGPFSLILYLLRGNINFLICHRWEGARGRASFPLPQHYMADKGYRASSPSLMISRLIVYLCPHQQSQHYYGAQVRYRACFLSAADSKMLGQFTGSSDLSASSPIRHSW